MRVYELPYRPEIDGLRAVAVGSVLCFHAFPGRLPGGFVGVDIFFVISGYLITSIIVGQLQENRFSLGAFYAARIRRIFPSLILVLLSVLLTGSVLLMSADYAALAGHAVAGAGFVSNLLLWSESGYFDVNAASKPLLHLWSLGIEEQFYVAWPLILIAVARLRWNAVWGAVAIMLLSFADNVHLTSTDAIAAFFSPAARAWELMLGAAVALLPKETFSPSTRNFAALAGGGAILLALFMIGGSSAFPGWWALLPTTGAALVILAGPSAWINRQLLASGPFVSVGRISYPLYLWHWPILSFLLIRNGDVGLSISVRLAALVAATVLAFGTYYLVEGPVGGRRRYGTPALLATMTTIALGAVMVLASGGLPGRALNQDPRRQFVERYKELHRDGLSTAYRFECDFYDWKSGRRRASISADCTKPGDKRTFLLWGDSHAQALSLGLRSGMPKGTRLAQVATSGCRPRLEPTVVQTPGGACDISNAFALATVKRLRPDTVILAQQRDHETTDWLTFARVLKDAGARRVVLIGPLPDWEPSLPQVVAKHYWSGDRQRVSIGLDPAVARTDAVLAARYRQSSDLTVISVQHDLCNANGCLAVVPGHDRDTLMAVDYAHLSLPGSRYVADRILLGPLLQPPAPNATAAASPLGVGFRTNSARSLKSATSR